MCCLHRREKRGGELIIQLSTTLQVYEFIQKLFLRLQKYAARGITVLNPPEGSLEYPAKKITTIYNNIKFYIIQQYII